MIRTPVTLKGFTRQMPPVHVWRVVSPTASTGRHRWKLGQATEGSAEPPFEGVVQHEPWELAVDFVNTVTCPPCRTYDILSSSPGRFKRWNLAHPELPKLEGSGAIRTQLMELRQNIREIFQRQASGKTPDPRSLLQLNRILHDSPVHPNVAFDMGRWRIQEILEQATPLHECKWKIARATAILLGGMQVGRLLNCQAPRCKHFVVRRTRDQIWCSPACANRARVARWRMLRKTEMRRREDQS